MTEKESCLKLLVEDGKKSLKWKRSEEKNLVNSSSKDCKENQIGLEQIKMSFMKEDTASTSYLVKKLATLQNQLPKRITTF